HLGLDHAGGGQRDPEGAAFAGAALDAARAVEAVDDALHDGQPQPVALRLFAVKAAEHLEQPILIGGRDAAPVILHLVAHLIAGTIHVHTPNNDAWVSVVLADILHRVLDQVREDVF